MYGSGTAPSSGEAVDARAHGSSVRWRKRCVHEDSTAMSVRRLRTDGSSCDGSSCESGTDDEGLDEEAGDGRESEASRIGTSGCTGGLGELWEWGECVVHAPSCPRTLVPLSPLSISCRGQISARPFSLRYAVLLKSRSARGPGGSKSQECAGSPHIHRRPLGLGGVAAIKGKGSVFLSGWLAADSIGAPTDRRINPNVWVTETAVDNLTESKNLGRRQVPTQPQLRGKQSL
ncbi:hypothetical protein B0H16DRAFT_1702336 [Mycena metata]|uniref:Uncharacterized protein n=1 Tax=Mycena metata TaxID=1033252 RepID=A0AAD7MEH9_9AGAR|nr:hypothetical protein B0H16DRAFT_1702336 [Mycena metata]